MADRKKIVGWLAIGCGILWIAAAIHPADRQAWLLENILLVLLVAVLFFTADRLRLSVTSYVLLAVFIVLHIAGAHYTYAKMPLGLWAQHAFGLSRNHYDRLAHGAFGFLLVFPVRELLLRFSGIRKGWSFWLAPAVILAFSGLFEILEGIVTEAIAPGQGVTWLGGQGDQWDAQNDMLSSLIGSLLMMAAVFLVERKRER